MRVCEWIAASYLFGLAVAALAVPVSWRRRLLVAGLALAASGAVVLLAAIAAASPGLELARDWAPAAYLMIGYWLPGGLQRPPDGRLEAWFLAMDRRLLGRLGLAHPPDRSCPPTGWSGAVLEAVYVLVYPFVPACFLLLYASGAATAFDPFWSAVLLAGYASYASLPWLPARPPRHLETSPDTGAAPKQTGAPPRPGRLRQLNERVSGAFSVGGNTFPSGHVAVASAAALVVAQVFPLAGALLAALTLLIATATVVQRYHYAVDALAGLALGLAAGLIVLAGMG